MTALVTGAAGFIGSHLAETLLHAGHAVIALDDLSGGDRRNVPEGAVFYEGSILDEALLERIFQEHTIDFVCHLAAYAAEGLSHFIRRFNYRNNLIGSVNLINCSVRYKVRCFLFTSSIAVYGAGHGDEPLIMTERSIPMPEDPYGIAKRAAELDLDAAHRMFGLNYLVFRPHNVYGERQNIGDRYRNVIGIFMNQILRDEPMTIFGDGSQTRNFTYVGDVVPAMVTALERPEVYNRVYNIGADVATPVNQLAGYVARAMGVAPQIQHMPERLEVKHALADHSKVARDLGYSARTTLEEGIGRMAAWAKASGSRATSTFGEIEIEEKLPDSWKRTR